MLDLPTATHPVAVTQQFQPAKATPPAIQAFDCFHPTDVKTYDISQHCPTADPAQEDPHQAEVYILQQDFTHRAPGFRCSMTRGTRRFVCGTFSYEKALRGPVGQLPVTLSGTECHQLVSTREYTDEKKKIHPVKVPGMNEIAVDEIGWESTIDGDQRCQGQRVDIDGHPVDRVVEYSTVMIIIKAEEFVMADGKVSAEYSRETLSCPASQGRCSGASHAYTWNLLSMPPCPWKIARTSHGTLTTHTYSSRKDGLLFALSQPSSDIRCPGLHIRQTGFPDLALVETRPSLPRLAGGEVRLALLFQVFQEYLMDRLDQLSAVNERTYARFGCQERSQNEKPGSLRSLGNGRFARRMGDTHVEFSCPSLEVNLREDDHCYTAEIPVHHDDYPFATVANRVLTMVGTASPCLDDYPLRVKGTHGWWRLLPHIEADVPPRVRAAFDEPLHHQFDRQGGLYSVGELRQWQHLQEVPHYQNLLTADLAQGVCSGFEGCALTPVPGAPSYTLSNLEANALQAFTPAWVENLQAVVYWGGLVLAWLSPFGFFLVFRALINRRAEAAPSMFPMNIHTSSVNNPTMNPTVVTTDLRATVNTASPQQVLDDYHVGARPVSDGLRLRDGGCNDPGPADYVRGGATLLPGPSKRLPTLLNPSSV